MDSNLQTPICQIAAFLKAYRLRTLGASQHFEDVTKAVERSLKKAINPLVPH